MSELSVFGLRRRVLVVATVAVLASMGATSAMAQARLNFSGIEGGAEAYDGFIVKYREGTPAHANAARMKQSIDRASAQSVLVPGQEVRLNHVRRMALGADVVRPNRALGRAEAERLMRQIAADPDVEYVELDLIMRPTLTPNDTHYGLQYGYGSGAGGLRADQAWDLSTGAGVVVAV